MEGTAAMTTSVKLLLSAAALAALMAPPALAKQPVRLAQFSHAPAPTNSKYVLPNPHVLSNERDPAIRFSVTPNPELAGY
jgi:hypothetical protein